MIQQNGFPSNNYVHVKNSSTDSSSWAYFAAKFQPANASLAAFNDTKYISMGDFITLESGSIDRKNISEIDLFAAQNYCPLKKSRHRFTKCMHNFWHVAPAGQSRNSTQQKHSLFAIPHAFVNSEGNVFNRHGYYIHGGCSDFSWATWDFSYKFSPTFNETTNITVFNEPIVNLVQPYENNFCHEIFDVYSYFVSIEPFISMYPLAPVLLRSKLEHVKMLPLLRALGIDYDNLRIRTVPSWDVGYASTLVYSPLVIVPLSTKCGVIEKEAVPEFRAAIASLLVDFNITKGNDIHHDSTTDKKNQIHKKGSILIYDRLIDSTRHLIGGSDVLSRLREVYSPPPAAAAAASSSGRGKKKLRRPHRDVHRFIGNESLPKTMELFHHCACFIAAHGAGMTNMIFLRENTSIIEIRPINYQVQVFQEISTAMNFKHVVFIAGKGRQHGQIPLNVQQFVDYAVELIDRIDI
jgi:hypothetical protein